MIDPKLRTPEQMEADSDEGHAIAMNILPVFHGMSPMVAYNVLGTLVSHIFGVIQFEQPQHALEEFDNWKDHTREHLTGIIKERMQ